MLCGGFRPRTTRRGGGSGGVVSGPHDSVTEERAAAGGAAGLVCARIASLGEREYPAKVGGRPVSFGRPRDRLLLLCIPLAVIVGDGVRRLASLSDFVRIL